MSNKPLYTAVRIVPRSQDFLDRYSGERGEVFFDEATNTLRLFNGTESGGFSLAKNDLSNVSQEDFVQRASDAGLGSTSITVSNTAPLNPNQGNLWLNNRSGILYVYYQDGTSNQWVQTATSATGATSNINFPSNPTTNQVFTSGAVSWKWTGAAWEIVAPTSLTLTGLTSTSASITTITNNTTITSTNTNTTNLSVATNGTISGIPLSKLSDVSISSPTNNALLTYNATQQKWIAGSATGFNGGTITNPLVINNATATTGTSSGALRVAGGVSIGDDLYIAGTLTIEDENIEIKTSGELRLYNTNNTAYVGFSAPDTISANRIYVLPQSDGTSGQYLRTNGSGILSWASVTSPSGGTPPGGVDTNVQYNDAGEFGGNAAFTFNAESQKLTVPDIDVTGLTTVLDDTESTDEFTGSVQVTGGVGIEKQLNVAGAVNRFSGMTESISTTTGTIVVTGGIGVSGSMNVGSTVSATTAPSNAEHLTNKRYVDANILAFAVAFGA